MGNYDFECKFTPIFAVAGANGDEQTIHVEETMQFPGDGDSIVRPRLLCPNACCLWRDIEKDDHDFLVERHVEGRC